jgi:hypothetical protein
MKKSGFDPIIVGLGFKKWEIGQGNYRLEGLNRQFGKQKKDQNTIYSVLIR